MFKIIQWIIWIGAVTAFIASGYFIKAIQGMMAITGSANTYFWVKMPIELQYIILGLICALVLMGIRILSRD